MIRTRPGRLPAACFALLFGTLGCAGRLPHAPLPADARCVDGSYRGRYLSADGERRRFSVRARVCEGAPTVLEVRGIAGGAALLAGLDGEAMRILLPRDRLAIEGSSADVTPWERELGLPLTGRLLLALLRGGAARVGPWRLEATGVTGPEERLPPGYVATHPDGDRLELRKTREQPSPRAGAWPEIPAGFEVRRYGP